MVSISAPSDPIIRDIQKWKKDQAIISLTLDEMLEKAQGKKILVEQKVDGQSSILEYKKGQEPRFGSLHGIIMTGLPILSEATQIFQKNDINQIKIVGELAGYENGKILSFNESESLIKNPQSDKSKVHWFPYQILELNGAALKDNFETYVQNWPQIQKLFKAAQYIHPVESATDIKSAYQVMVDKEKNEGIVVRLSDNKVYKVKPLFSYDLAVIAVGDKKKKNWPKGMIGTTLMAFMDKDSVFRTAGEVGTGWTDKERHELFQWAQKNKVGEDDRYVWVRPEKIMEVIWERSHIKEMPAYSYSDGKYTKEDKRMSGSIVKPRFKRYRTDKAINPSDLRLTQIPDWKEQEKCASRVIRAFLKDADYPDHPHDQVLPGSDWNPKPVSELEIYEYYEGIKSKIIPELKGKDLFIGIVPKGYKQGQKPVYIRHPYDKKTEFIRINNTEDFETYHSGRAVEYHWTMPQMVPCFIIDYDAGDEPFSKTCQTAADIVGAMEKIPEVRSVSAQFTGKRGFHIVGDLKEAMDVDKARDFLRGWLKQTFGDREDLIIGESPSGKKGALGLTSMKLNGGHSALYSMRVTGLCCIDVPKAQLPAFKREDAAFDKVYEKLTGKSFMTKKASEDVLMASRVITAYLNGNSEVTRIKYGGYDREKLVSGFKGKFVIQNHEADKAGGHFDVRLEFPVVSLSKSLGHYKTKRDNDTSEPMKKYPEKGGTVYRSFVDKKQKLPTGSDKIYLIETEDHPVEYGSFSGTIEEGYGKGEVSVWDKGTYELLDVSGDHKYILKFNGNKLKGIYALIKYKDGFLWVKTKYVKEVTASRVVFNFLSDQKLWHPGNRQRYPRPPGSVLTPSPTDG